MRFYCITFRIQFQRFYVLKIFAEHVGDMLGTPGRELHQLVIAPAWGGQAGSDLLMADTTGVYQ